MNYVISLQLSILHPSCRRVCALLGRVIDGILFAGGNDEGEENECLLHLYILCRGKKGHFTGLEFPPENSSIHSTNSTELKTAAFAVA